MRDLSRQIAREVENALDDVDVLLRELTRVRGALVDIDSRGPVAPQIAMMIGSGMPVDVDVRKMSELAGRCAKLNLLRDIASSVTTTSTS